jgi:hypothetical protein
VYFSIGAASLSIPVCNVNVISAEQCNASGLKLGDFRQCANCGCTNTQDEASLRFIYQFVTVSWDELAKVQVPVIARLLPPLPNATHLLPFSFLFLG